MNIKLNIDVTDRALEFSRNMGSLFVNLGVIDKESLERSANRPVQKALDEHAEKVSHEPPVDASWNTDPIEPDNLKVETPTPRELPRRNRKRKRLWREPRTCHRRLAGWALSGIRRRRRFRCKGNPFRQ